MHVTRLIAIRHGETDWNAARRLQGHVDVPLNEQGRAQAQAVAQALMATGEEHDHDHDAIAAGYASDLSRAFETGRAIAEAVHAPITAVRNLRERHFGDWEGNNYADLSVEFPADTERWRKHDPEWGPPGATENLRQFGERIGQTVQELAAQHVGQQIVIATHGGVLDVLYRLATGLGVQDTRTWDLGNAAINRLLWTPESGLKLVGWGDTRHLERSLNLEIGDDARQ
jgi:probable phosphoglycerate mutase